MNKEMLRKLSELAGEYMNNVIKLADEYKEDRNTVVRMITEGFIMTNLCGDFSRYEVTEREHKNEQSENGKRNRRNVAYVCKRNKRGVAK